MQMMPKWFKPSENWRERGLPKPGRKVNFMWVVLAKRFGVSRAVIYKVGIMRLVSCKDDLARRLLLGASQKGTTDAQR
jgi:hypothetical protein